MKLLLGKYNINLQIIKYFFIPYFAVPPWLLFTNEFMLEFTEFANWKQLVNEFNYYRHTPITVKVYTPEWDEFIRRVSVFNSWEEMKRTAERKYYEENPLGPYYFL